MLKPKTQLIFALFMPIVAGTIWLVFLRPVPMLSAKGIISSKTYSPPSEYTQYQSGNRTGFRQPTKVPIADGYLVNIRVKEWKKSIVALLNTSEAQRFEVGTPVSFDYEERSIPFVWNRIYVFNVKVLTK
jgi:hypothetical protein